MVSLVVNLTIEIAKELILFFVTLKEDPGITGEEEIKKILLSIEKIKFQISFYPVPPESSSGSIRRKIDKY